MEELPVKPKPNMTILGVNIGVMALYAALCLASGGSGALLMWILMLLHVGVCFVNGIVCAASSRYGHNALPWFLSCGIILLIDLSTCYLAVSGGIGHLQGN